MKSGNDNFRDEAEMLLQRASQMFPEKAERKSPTAIYFAIALFLVIGATFYRPAPTIQNSTVVGRDQIITHITAPRMLRNWQDLSLDERQAIKAAAREHFPEIANIGQNVDWRPISAWMADNYSVTANNTRDLFREPR